VARLGAIHGPGRSVTLTRFLRGESVIDPGSDRYMNHVHRDDIAAALLLLADAPPRENAIYNVVDNTPILRGECYRWLAEKLGRNSPPANRVSPAKRGRSNKRVSNLRLRECGWIPRYFSFPVAMEGSILPSFGL